MLPEKSIFLHFFPIFLSNGPVHLWKLIIAPKYLTGATSGTIFDHLEQFLAMKMAISNSENWLKNKKMRFFQLFYTFLCPMDLYTSGKESVHQNTLLGPPGAPFWTQKCRRKLKISQSFDFSTSFLSGIWSFSGLKTVADDPKQCRWWPQ